MDRNVHVEQVVEGTGTTMFVANQLGRKSVGIDISREYLEFANQRTATLL